MKHIKNIDEFNLSEEDKSRYLVWEIISFKNKETGEIISDIPENELPRNHNIDDWNYIIYSVKRTTDGQIFTLGDEIGFKFSSKKEVVGKITWMFVSHYQLRLDLGRLGFPLTDDLIKI